MATKLSLKIGELFTGADRLNAAAHTADELMESITILLNEKMLKYNWVGFYMLEDGDNPMLALGHYRGAMTPHTRIALNQGICGAAASSGKTVVVDDVRKDSRYLACSLETRSEIVVPVFVHGKVAGELDMTVISPRRSAPRTANWLNIARSSWARDWRNRHARVVRHPCQRHLYNRDQYNRDQSNHAQCNHER